MGSVSFEGTETAHNLTRNRRASQFDMEKRARKILDLATKTGFVTSRAVETELGITYTQTNTVLKKLVMERKLMPRRAGQAIHYVPVKTATASPRQFEISDLRLGQTLRVTGLHFTPEGSSIDVQTDDTTFHLHLAS